MASEESKEKKRKGLIVTTTVHIIVLVLFCLFGFEIIDPKPGGMEIEWAIEGVENAGGENNQENTSEETSTENQTPHEATSASASASQEEQIETVDNSDVAVESSPIKKATSTKTPPNKVTETKTEETKEVKEEPKQTKPSWMEAIEAKRTSKQGPNSSGGEGTGDNIGKEGTPDGGGTSKSGKGVGNGRWDVQGRAATKVDKKVNNCNATGKIRVYIKIDESGRVYDAVVRGGTSQNECLMKVAKEQAKAIKYAPGNSKNEGVVTIDLSL